MGGILGGVGVVGHTGHVKYWKQERVVYSRTTVRLVQLECGGGWGRVHESFDLVLKAAVDRG